jgi:hypothetical protein
VAAALVLRITADLGTHRWLHHWLAEATSTDHTLDVVGRQKRVYAESWIAAPMATAVNEADALQNRAGLRAVCRLSYI